MAASYTTSVRSPRRFGALLAGGHVQRNHEGTDRAAGSAREQGNPTVDRSVQIVLVVGSVLLCSTLGCSRDAPGPVDRDLVTILDGEEAVAALDQCSRESPENWVGTWRPSDRDAQVAEGVLRSYVARRLSRPLDTYLRQYVGFVRPGGKRFLYVHASSDPDGLGRTEIPSWKWEYMWVCGGGEDSWGAEFSMRTLRFSRSQPTVRSDPHSQRSPPVARVSRSGSPGATRWSSGRALTELGTDSFDFEGPNVGLRSAVRWGAAKGVIRDTLNANDSSRSGE